MRKSVSRSIVILAVVMLSGCAYNGYDGYNDQRYYSPVYKYGFSGHSKFGFSSFGHGKFGHSKFGRRGFIGSSRFGGHRGFGHRGFRGHRGFGRSSFGRGFHRRH